MNGCWLMWLGEWCIRLGWWGLCSCWENCTGWSAARLPATLLITGTVWDCDVFKPDKTQWASSWSVQSKINKPGHMEGVWGWTYSVLWPWLQIEAWWGSVSAGGYDGNCGCLSTCWLEEVLHLNLKSEEKNGKWNYTAILLLSFLVLAEYSTKPEHLLCKFMFKVKQMLLLNKQQAWCWLSSDSFEQRCSCVTHVVPRRKKNGKKKKRTQADEKESACVFLQKMIKMASVHLQ